MKTLPCLLHQERWLTQEEQLGVSFDQYNLFTVLKLTGEISQLARFNQLIDHVFSQHLSLQISITATAKGVWQQTINPYQKSKIIKIVKPKQPVTMVLKYLYDQSVAYDQYPLYRFYHIKAQEGDFLLLVISHLISDAEAIPLLLENISTVANRKTIKPDCYREYVEFDLRRRQQGVFPAIVEHYAALPMPSQICSDRPAIVRQISFSYLQMKKITKQLACSSTELLLSLFLTAYFNITKRDWINISVPTSDRRIHRQFLNTSGFLSGPTCISVTAPTILTVNNILLSVKKSLLTLQQGYFPLQQIEQLLQKNIEYDMAFNYLGALDESLLRGGFAKFNLSVG